MIYSFKQEGQIFLRRSKVATKARNPQKGGQVNDLHECFRRIDRDGDDAASRGVLRCHVTQRDDAISMQWESTGTVKPRMSWVVVTDDDGRRQLRMLWR